MGSSQNKNENIDIYIEVSRPYFVAGEYVDGFAYLNVKAEEPYFDLNIRVMGDEYVYWTENHGSNGNGGNNISYYSNRYNSYNCAFSLTNFDGKVPKGQYTFPFSFLLPAMMSGSFTQSSSCYIKYLLRAQLNGSKDTQYYDIYLNIIEPPRVRIGPVRDFQKGHTKCCDCCWSYGTIGVTLNCSTNFVRSGDRVQISGQIDNKEGSTKIKNSEVKLQIHRIMVDTSGYSDDQIDNQYSLGQIGNVHSGQAREFNFEAVIPSTISQYTAIGRVTARYFLLHLELDYGCCVSKINAAVHLIFHSRSPKLLDIATENPPPAWNPKVYPKCVYQNMKPYISNPMAAIKYLNMSSDVNQMNGWKNEMNPQAYMDYSPSYFKKNEFSYQPQGENPYNAPNSSTNLYK